MLLHKLVLELFDLITQLLIDLPAFIANLALSIQLAVFFFGGNQFLELVRIFVQELMKALDDLILKIILINKFRINSNCIRRCIDGKNITISIRNCSSGRRQYLFLGPELLRMGLPKAGLNNLEPKHSPHQYSKKEGNTSPY
ncbi:hypothetical protein D3C81_1744440 [compost metagenome]